MLGNSKILWLITLLLMVRQHGNNAISLFKIRIYPIPMKALPSIMHRMNTCWAVLFVDNETLCGEIDQRML